ILATLLLPWRAFFRRPQQKLAYILCLAVAVGVALAAGSTTAVSRAQTIIHPGSDRGSGRTDLWDAAWHGYSRHPWLGLGAGNFRAHSLDLLMTTPGVNIRAHYVAPGREVHNAYLETLTELGPVGFVLFLLVLTLTAWYCVRSFRRARARGHDLLERYALSMLVSLLGYACGALFLSNELSKALWVFVGLALALDAITRRLPARPPSDS